MILFAMGIWGFLGAAVAVGLGIFIIYVAVSLGSAAYFKRYKDFLIWQKRFFSKD